MTLSLICWRSRLPSMGCFQAQETPLGHCVLLDLCDCSAMKGILNYDGQIHVVRRWAQELLGCHFAVIHRPARMTADVDALSRCCDGLIRQCMLHAAQLSAADRAPCLAACNPSAFPAHTAKCPMPVIVATPSIATTTPCPLLFVSAQPDASTVFTNPMLAFIDRVALTGCPASLVATFPPAIKPASSCPSLSSSVCSFNTSVARKDSSLSAQPLATAQPNIWSQCLPHRTSVCVKFKQPQS
jgi:hypothetical protein